VVTSATSSALDSVSLGAALASISSSSVVSTLTTGSPGDLRTKVCLAMTMSNCSVVNPRSEAVRFNTPTNSWIMRTCVSTASFLIAVFCDSVMFSAFLYSARTASTSDWLLSPLSKPRTVKLVSPSSFCVSVITLVASVFCSSVSSLATNFVFMSCITRE